MSKIAAIGRVGIIAALAMIIVIASLGVYAYTDTSQMTTAKTASTPTPSIFYNDTSHKSTFNPTNMTTSTNPKTGTDVSNYTLATTSTVPSSKTNSTSNSTAVESSESPSCIPSPSYISTMTLTQQNTTSTEQVVYDGVTCNFGDNTFEPPSAILIPANTLVWTNFKLHLNGSYVVGATVSYYPFPESSGANVTVAIYFNGVFNVNSTTQIPSCSQVVVSSCSQVEVTNSSLIPPANSANNSIFALKGVTLSGGVGTQSDTVNLNVSTIITIAMVSDKPLWLAGWTPEDISKGTGPQLGQSSGQLNGTFEWPDYVLTLPSSLPQPTATLAFELQFTGDYF